MGFINKDTYEGELENPLSLNLYTYVENNPLKYTDPSGMSPLIQDSIVVTDIGGHTTPDEWARIGSGYIKDSKTRKERIELWTAFIGMYLSVSFDHDDRGGAGRGSVGKGNKGSSNSIINVGSKSDALRLIDSLPTNIQSSVKSFFKGGSNKYNSFEVIQSSNGGYLAKMIKPGNVPGSKAVYYKEITADGKTIKVYKETYDPSGKLVHLKDK